MSVVIPSPPSRAVVCTRPVSRRARNPSVLCFPGVLDCRKVKSRFDQAFYVYILAGRSGVLYTGMTNNLARRVSQHKQKRIPGFAQPYNLTKLVWFELHAGPKSAIAREKQISLEPFEKTRAD